MSIFKHSGASMYIVLLVLFLMVPSVYPVQHIYNSSEVHVKNTCGPVILMGNDAPPGYDSVFGPRVVVEYTQPSDNSVEITVENKQLNERTTGLWVDVSPYIDPLLAAAQKVGFQRPILASLIGATSGKVTIGSISQSVVKIGSYTGTPLPVTIKCDQPTHPAIYVSTDDGNITIKPSLLVGTITARTTSGAIWYKGRKLDARTYTDQENTSGSLDIKTSSGNIFFNI